VSSSDADRPLVLGVGNVHRHDDGVGPAAVARAAPRLGDRARVLAWTDEPTALLDAWKGLPLVVVVDALAPGRTPGRIHRWSSDDDGPPPSAPTTSTHGVGVAEVWALADSLDARPDRLVVLGIEGADFSPGIGLSPTVSAALVELTERIVVEVVGPPGPAGGLARA
jgi:hydrogenase maturation protease